MPHGASGNHPDESSPEADFCVICQRQESAILLAGNRRVCHHPTGVGFSMTLNVPDALQWRRMSAWMAAVLAVLISGVMVAVTPTQANAVATPVPLGTAADFAVLAGSEITNTGPSVITGDIGVHPGTAISGFPPGLVIGEQHSADEVAAQAKTDLVAAYDDAAGQDTDAALPPDAGGLTLVPGVYTAASTLGLTGTLTLDAQGDPSAVWVFQVGSALTTASGSDVVLVNGASPCNVFWQIGSSATLGTNSTFVGNILAMTSITVTTGTTIDGRALARNAAVTLDTNTINRGTCAGGTGGTTGGVITGGVIAGTTGGTATGGTATGGTTGGVVGGVLGGVTTGGVLGGVTTGGVVGGVLGGVTTGGVIAGTTGGTTGGSNGGTTGGSNGGTTGGIPKPPGKPKPPHGDHGHGKPKPPHGDHGYGDHEKPGEQVGYGSDECGLPPQCGAKW
ncbi:ice-binding family protein [Streptomyces sp. NPDC006551]|uniref:ice-binding family protein n=1 Tax=Streptomyces sp. NPDC006551 TaxID=3157178 RepID=UPI0033A85D7E